MGTGDWGHPQSPLGQVGDTPKALGMGRRGWGHPESPGDSGDRLGTHLEVGDTLKVLGDPPKVLGMGKGDWGHPKSFGSGDRGLGTRLALRDTPKVLAVGRGNWGHPKSSGAGWGHSWNWVTLPEVLGEPPKAQGMGTGVWGHPKSPGDGDRGLGTLLGLGDPLKVLGQGRGTQGHLGTFRRGVTSRGGHRNPPGTPKVGTAPGHPRHRGHGDSGSDKGTAVLTPPGSAWWHQGGDTGTGTEGHGQPGVSPTRRCHLCYRCDRRGHLSPLSPPGDTRSALSCPLAHQHRVPKLGDIPGGCQPLGSP